jgi:queuine tRNA-ribosyltransferase
MTDTQSAARAGILRTAHGEVPTPVFMPVGTNATVKALSQEVLSTTLQARIILGNTYHLHLRPGEEIVAAAGGLHRFMNWSGPILTDSGGYQVFSLAESRKVRDDGVHFQSHIDGSHHVFTPESVIRIQRDLGADIIMAFDECTPYPASMQEAEASMNLTHTWLDRSLQAFADSAPRHDYDQFMYPIIQGSVFSDLRHRSCDYILRSAHPGHAIGGLSVGEPAEQLYAMTDLCCSLLPADKPRYLMGVGTPENLLRCISLGIDMFDCVMPTRHARNGHLFTSSGILNIRNQKWHNDFSPIDPEGTSSASTYSKAYLRHLFNANELLAHVIASIHNLSFYLHLMQISREKILSGTFTTWRDTLLPKLSQRL